MEQPQAKSSGQQPPISPDGARVEAIYFNGFNLALSLGDVVVTLLLQGQPTRQLNISYTMAKTLGVSLVDAISKLEAATGNHIMTVEEVFKVSDKLVKN